MKPATIQDEGYSARLQGAEIDDNPWVGGSLQHEAWAEGWNEADEMLSDYNLKSSTSIQGENNG